MTAIYKIRNLVNGKFYVGSSVDTRVRFQNHRRHLRKGTHHCHPLQRAWNKYGEDFFKFEIVEKVTSSDDLHAAENRWLDEHHGKAYCYNLSKCADAPTRGMKFSDEHKAKISAAHMGNSYAKGHKQPAEQCESTRLRKLGNTNFLGKSHTDDTKATLSKAHQGKQHRLGHTNTPEHRARQSAGMRGIKKSPEHAEKIRQRMIGTSYAKGRIVTEEMRAARGRAVAETTTGLQFISVAAAAQYFGLQKANLIRTLRTGGTLKRGPNAGLHFQYAEPVAPA